jgi:Tol biopolymer transport system component
MYQKNFFSTLLVFGSIALMLVSCKIAKPVIPAKPTVKIDLTPGVTADARELTRIANDAQIEQFPQISPDGKFMIYEVIDRSKTNPTTKYSIVMKKLGEQGVVPLMSEGSRLPSWMGDNNSFLFAYTKPGKPVIAKSRIDQMGINYISPTANGDYDSYPHFFKAQNKVLFFTLIGGEYQVCTVDLNGLNFTVLAPGQDPFPHPTKNLITFSKKVGANWQIFKYDFVLNQQTQLTSGDFNYLSPTISADGNWITYQSSKQNDLDSHIFVMSINGGAVKQITNGSTYNWCPTLASDGYIYFCSNAGSDQGKRFDNYDIWRVKPNLNN